MDFIYVGDIVNTHGLKGEIRSLRTKLEVLRDTGGAEVNNSDLLRRLSNLEKIIYGEK